MDGLYIIAVVNWEKAWRWNENFSNNAKFMHGRRIRNVFHVQSVAVINTGWQFSRRCQRWHFQHQSMNRNQWQIFVVRHLGLSTYFISGATASWLWGWTKEMVEEINIKTYFTLLEKDDLHSWQCSHFSCMLSQHFLLPKCIFLRDERQGEIVVLYIINKSLFHTDSSGMGISHVNPKILQYWHTRMRNQWAA